MARLARMVIPGVPHHVTQRGNRRERIFFEVGDEQIYLDLMTAQLRRHSVECWAYCLMPNHVHFILTPSDSWIKGSESFIDLIEAGVRVSPQVWRFFDAATASSHPCRPSASRHPAWQ